MFSSNPNTPYLMPIILSIQSLVVGLISYVLPLIIGLNLSQTSQ